MTLSAATAGCPIASENLQIEETGTDVIVFDPAVQSFHLLNATARSILRACNGSNTIKDIAGILSLEFNCDDADALLDDVSETIRQLRERRLVIFVIEDQSVPAVVGSTDEEGVLLAVSVTGTSMFPVLLSGDKALVRKTKIEDLNIGDIIVWSKQPGTLVAHRIISLNLSATPPLVTTKGDLVIEPDAPVENDRVVGKIAAVLRGGQVQWLRQIDGVHGSCPNSNGKTTQTAADPANTMQLPTGPSFSSMKVLDLRDISVESIRNIGSVKDISLVLLSPENAAAWSNVIAQDVKTVITVAKNYRVYTGQPELVPELLEFTQEPLRLLVSGQIFLTAFGPDQILETLAHLILSGQAYVSSVESKTALESVTTFLSGQVCVIPTEHVRWIGESLLGPEYIKRNYEIPLVAIGDLRASQRLDSIPENISQFNTVVQQALCKSVQ